MMKNLESRFWNRGYLMASLSQQVNIRTNSTFVTAILMIAICDLIFIGGAYYLCAYKGWSLWTIFWALFIACSTTKSIYKIIGIKDKDDERD